MHERVLICGSFDMRNVSVFAKMPSDHVNCFAPFSMCLVVCFYLLVICFLLCIQSENTHRCWGFLFACHWPVCDRFIVRFPSKWIRHVFVSFTNMCSVLPILRSESDFSVKGVNTTETKNSSQRLLGVFMDVFYFSLFFPLYVVVHHVLWRQFNLALLHIPHRRFARRDKGV